MALTDQIQNVQLSNSLSDQFALIDQFKGNRSTNNAPLVRSFIKAKGISARPTEISPDSVFVLGTAISGGMFMPILPDPTTITTEFGDIPQNQTKETSLVRGFFELFNSIQLSTADIRVIRIGNASKASIVLPERGLIGAARFQGGPIDPSDRAVVDANRRKVSILLESIEEGDRFNNIFITIENQVAAGIENQNNIDNLSANIYTIVFSGLPDGSIVIFDNVYIGKDKGVRSSGNFIINAPQLARAINDDPVLGEFVTASVFFLQKKIDFIIRDRNGGFDQTIVPDPIYNDVSPMLPSVIDPDVDKYILVDATTPGQDNIYNPGALFENSSNPQEIIFNLLFKYGVVSPLIDNSGNFGGNIKEEDVGKIVVIRAISEKDETTLPQSIIDVFGYYIITQSGLSTAPLGGLNSALVETVPTPSWGDNVAFLRNVSSLDSGDFEISAGSTTFNFTETPNKVITEDVKTIQTFIRRVVGEDGIVVTPKVNLSASTITFDVLDYFRNRYYDATGTFTSLLTRTTNGTVLVANDEVDIFLIRSGAETAIEIADDSNPTGLINGKQFTFNKNTGEIVWNQDYVPDPLVTTDPPAYPLQLGDRVLVSYKYEVTYREAKLRSRLVIGDVGTYFVTGPTIIFGAAQPNELEVSFRRDNLFSINEVILQANNPEFGIEFIRNDLVSGEKLSIAFSYAPELPGPPEAVDNVPNNIWRMSGGSDGTYGSSNSEKTRYKEELIRAYRLIEAWPCRVILPVGAYIDDVLEGFNFETGLSEPVNAGFHLDLALAVNRKSQNIRECTGIVATRPPTISNPDPIQSLNWISRHIVVDPEDTTRAANIIQAFGGPGTFRMSCVVGTPIVQLPIAGLSIANPAFIYAGMKEDLIGAENLERSMINRVVPGTTQQAVIITSLEDISDFATQRYTAMTFNVQQQQFVISDAPTLAIPNSQFTRQYVVDVVELAINLIREVGEKFIGRPRKQEILTAMRAQMGLALRKMVPINLIDYTVQIGDVPDGNITGKVRVLLTLTTSVEIRQIDIETEIRLG